MLLRESQVTHCKDTERRQVCPWFAELKLFHGAGGILTLSLNDKQDLVVQKLKKEVGMQRRPFRFYLSKYILWVTCYD